MSEPVRRRLFGLAFLVLTLATVVPFLRVSAQEQSESRYDVRANYEKHEYQIPMRDGVKLFTSVYSPKDKSHPYPFLMTRTPYSIAPYGSDNYDTQLGPSEVFGPERFIFVYQDVRGQMMSEGEFVNMRPILSEKHGPKVIDESTDTYDTVEWLLRRVPNNNGRVGIYGISYPGFYTAAGIINGHPAIKAASPQAPIGDWFIGDDFHHHGAFYLQDVFDFFSFFGQKRSGPTMTFPPRFEYNSEDAYDFFLRMGPLREANNKYLHGEVAFWNESMEHGTYDEFWQSRNLIPHMKNVHSAVMTVAGWFDAEDPYGPIQLYRSIEQQNPGIQNTLVVGPWIHGGWSRNEGDRLGRVSFHEKTGAYFREKIELGFFKRYLKDEGEANLPEALVFITGSNSWQSFDSWPPKSAGSKALYPAAGGGLAFDPPSDSCSDIAADSYLSDPSKPVPYTSEIRIKRSVTYMVEDQRFASRRPDVLVYESPELSHDLTLVGPVVPDLFISSTGTDADFVVKLIDVFPNNYQESNDDRATRNGRPDVPLAGYQMLVRGDVMRARFRNSYEHPEALVPNQVSEVRFQMPDIAHTFKRGHRVMVQIQSSWFPLVDRNPQKFVDIYTAGPSDFQPATLRVYRSGQHASKLIVNELGNQRPATNHTNFTKDR